MVGQRRILRIVLALLQMAADVLFVVLVVGPLRRAPIHRRHEIVVARRDHAAGLFGALGLRFAAHRDRLERRRDVGHLLDPLAHDMDVGLAFHAAWAGDVDRSRLIPVDTVGADDIVEQPALVLEPLHMRLAALVHDRLRNALHEILPRSFAVSWLSVFSHPSHTTGPTTREPAQRLVHGMAVIACGMAVRLRCSVRLAPTGPGS